MCSLRYLLFPFAWMYGLGLRIRHALYDIGLLKSTRPIIPTIAIGNLSLGGTGKTPHVELFLEMLHDRGQLATLSRGYGRRSTGFIEVTLDRTSPEVGDEPLQLKRKFPDVLVFVGEDRVEACSKIQQLHAHVKAILLDDALQHRRLNAGLKVLLTEYDRPYCDDHLLPVGRLRDLRSRAGKADVMVVTKMKEEGDNGEKVKKWKERLGLKEGQRLFLSGLEYGEPYEIQEDGTKQVVALDRQMNSLLLTGIANAKPLVDHLKPQMARVQHLEYSDHRAFTSSDLRKVAATYDTFAAGPKILLTTEKDAQRLLPAYWNGPLKDVPLIVQPMKVKILNDEIELSELLNAYVGEDQ